MCHGDSHEHSWSRHVYYNPVYQALVDVIISRLNKLFSFLVISIVTLGVEAFHATFIGHYPITQMPRFGWVLVYMVLIWAAMYMTGVTERNVSASGVVMRAAGALVLSTVSISALQLIWQTPLLPRFDVAATAVLLWPLMAFMAHLGEKSRAHRGKLDGLVAIVSPEEAERLRAEIDARPEKPAVLLATIDYLAALPTHAVDQPLVDLVRNCGASLVVANKYAQDRDEILEQVLTLHASGVRFRPLSLFYDEWLGKAPLTELEKQSLLFDVHEIHQPLYAHLKRLSDIVIACVGLVALGMVTPLVWVANLFGNRGPLFYTQQRVGKDSTVFTMIKFRTMRPHSDGEPEWTSADDDRVTPVGRLLRRTHLDELPQLVNVLRRDLSIVGPRPEQPHYVEQLSNKIPYYNVRHLVRPGMTGWAQIKYGYGANELDAAEKLQYEFYYMRHQGISLDLKIIGRTLRCMLLRCGR